MDFCTPTKVYKYHQPKNTSLWQLLHDHFLDFEYHYDDNCSKKHGFYQPIISHVVQKYLECGDLHQGFARIRSPDCHNEYLLTFCFRGQ